MTAYNLDFKDKKKFPLFEHLSYDFYYDTGFFKVDRWLGLSCPRYHWCFLVEITKIVRCVVPPIYPMYYGKDANGKILFIAFHTDDRSPHIERDCRVGDTLAIMYARIHLFRDGKIGIRVKLNQRVKLFHCSIKSILSLGGALNVTSCHVCDKPANTQCVNCAMKYCGKDCKTKDWEPNHKSKCNIGKSIRKWKLFDWGKFDYFRTP